MSRRKQDYFRRLSACPFAHFLLYCFLQEAVESRFSPVREVMPRDSLRSDFLDDFVWYSYRGNPFVSDEMKKTA